MRNFTVLIGIFLMFVGVYYLGKNITFTTDLYPFWWRGISSEISVLCLTIGIIGLFFFTSKDTICRMDIDHFGHYLCLSK